MDVPWLASAPLDRPAPGRQPPAPGRQPSAPSLAGEVADGRPQPAVEARRWPARRPVPGQPAQRPPVDRGSIELRLGPFEDLACLCGIVRCLEPGEHGSVSLGPPTSRTSATDRLSEQALTEGASRDAFRRHVGQGRSRKAWTSGLRCRRAESWCASGAAPRLSLILGNPPSHRSVRVEQHWVRWALPQASVVEQVASPTAIVTCCPLGLPWKSRYMSAYPSLFVS